MFQPPDSGDSIIARACQNPLLPTSPSSAWAPRVGGALTSDMTPPEFAP